MRKAAVCAAISAALSVLGCNSGSTVVPATTGGSGTTGSTTAASGVTGSTGNTFGGTTIGTSISGGSFSGASSSTAASSTSGTTSGSSSSGAGSTSSSTSSTTASSTGTSSTTSSSTTSSSTSSTGSSATTGAGPWPTTSLTSYGSAAGINEDIVDVSVDEAENIWAVSHDALYLLQPGQSSFHRYTASDGLNIANANSPGIMNVAGGKAGEVFVGYNGADWNGPGSPQITGDPTQDALLKEGGLDHVQLNADGTLTVVHPNVHSNDYWVNYPDGGSDSDSSFMEDRSTRRMVYDHRFHPGTLYVGWNHGVNRFNWGQTDPTTGAMYADHVHPIVDSYYPDGGVKTEWMGEWRALAIDPTQNGTLWMGGQYTGGSIGWTPGLHDWTCQSSNTTWCPNGANPFIHAWAKAWGAPLFPVAADGDSMNIRAVTVASDGTVYFASGPQWNPPNDPVYGVAVFKNGEVSYLDPVSQMHLPSNQIMDLVAMPDGTLAVAILYGGLYRYDPSTGTTNQVQGVPANIHMLYLDTLVTPAALYIATDQGVFVTRDAH